ncbi:MAG: TIM barrel protein [Acidobacteriaceae bacterium]|nr:TIM barrel protein [Acidobacteriaceae bacterium]
MTTITRRDQIRQLGCAALELLRGRMGSAQTAPQRLFFKIALGEYSFNSVYRAGDYDPVHLAEITKKEFGLSAIDYVSIFWQDKASDRSFLHELKTRAAANGIVNHPILVDLPGPQLGDLDSEKQKAAIEAHRRWVDIGRFLDCSGIRVNLNGFDAENLGKPGRKEAVLKASVEGYGHLLEYARQSGLDVLVQNHLGYSCDPDWLVSVMQRVNRRNAGIEADPGHFQELFIAIKPDGRHEARTGASFDTYAGMAKLMPYATAVNAKTHAFDANGNEVSFDWPRLLRIVKAGGYSGYIGIEWEPTGEGQKLSASQGIAATKALLERIGSEVS